LDEPDANRRGQRRRQHAPPRYGADMTQNHSATPRSASPRSPPKVCAGQSGSGHPRKVQNPSFTPGHYGWAGNLPSPRQRHPTALIAAVKGRDPFSTNDLTALTNALCIITCRRGKTEPAVAQPWMHAMHRFNRLDWVDFPPGRRFVLKVMPWRGEDGRVKRRWRGIHSPPSLRITRKWTGAI
jgi:hypothetical protein